MTKPYEPANGTEGLAFHERYCFQCAKDSFFDGGESCEILCRSFLGASHPDYPKEWIIGADGKPTCTAFERVEK